MDKIYSRSRIKLPKIFIKLNTGGKKFPKSIKDKKVHKVLIIITIVICILKLSMDYISPMFDSLCSLKAKGIATKIVNEKAKESLENVDYNDLITIIRDTNGNITMVKANVIAINRIASELTLEIQKALEDERETTIYIPTGSFLGNEVFYNIGPKIPIKLTSSGIVTTDFRSEFTNSGINQTIHRIYLYTVCKVNIVTPIKTISDEITNEVLVAETVLVGPIPDSYYNIQGLNSADQALEFVE